MALDQVKWKAEVEANKARRLSNPSFRPSPSKPLQPKQYSIPSGAPVGSIDKTGHLVKGKSLSDTDKDWAHRPGPKPKPDLE